MPTDNYLVQYRGTDFPDLFFTIKTASIESGEVHFVIQMRPESERSTKERNLNVAAGAIDKHFNRWVSMLEEYRSVGNPHEEIEEQFIKKSEGEFYELFELVDEDAYATSYDFETQLKISSLLESSIKLLELNRTSDNAKIIEELVVDAKDILDNQQNLSKGAVAKRISKFLARVKKFSFSICKEIVKDLIKDIAKKAIKGEIDYSNLERLLS